MAKNATKTKTSQCLISVRKLKTMFLAQKIIRETAPEFLSFIKKYGKRFASLRIALRLLLTVGTRDVSGIM